jgi:hypothetical protein
MTDDDHTPKAELDATSSDEGASPSDLAPLHVNDWFLQQLIEFAELGVELPIILSIGGSHINGNLIGGNRYFKELSELMSSSQVTSDVESVPGTLSKLFESYQDIYPQGDERPAFGTAKPNYIHLRDAKWHSFDGKALPSTGSLWRGKVSSVDGFMIGKLRVER